MATSEVLGVIASSPTDIQPVLDVVAKNAARLCEANDAQILRVEGDTLRRVAGVGSIPRASETEQGIFISRDWVGGRAVVDRRAIHVHDLAAEADSEFPESKRYQQINRSRTILAVPLVREGIPIGAIVIRRFGSPPV